MSDYKPTTDKYRMMYCGSALCRVNTFEHGRTGKCPGCGELIAEVRRLRAQAERVKAEALREAVRESDEGRRSPKPETSWRKYLLDRADAIERGET